MVKLKEIISNNIFFLSQEIVSSEHFKTILNSFKREDVILIGKKIFSIPICEFSDIIHSIDDKIDMDKENKLLS